MRRKEKEEKKRKRKKKRWEKKINEKLREEKKFFKNLNVVPFSLLPSPFSLMNVRAVQYLHSTYM
jgi:hypothetical protein